MGDEKNGDAKFTINSFEKSEDGLGGLRIESARCLVAQHDLGSRGEGAGNTNALLLSTRQLTDVGVALILQFNDAQHVLDPLLDRCLGCAFEDQGHRHVVINAFALQQVELLEDHADVTARSSQLFRAEGGQFTPIHVDGSCIRAFQLVDEPDEG